LGQPTRTWSSAELKIARFLGWVKTHWARKDSKGVGWSAEIKHGKQILKTLLKWWKQALRNTDPGDKTVLIMHPKGWKYEDSLVMLDLKTFRSIIYDAEEIARIDQQCSTEQTP
jgi:hypothetical protein